MLTEDQKLELRMKRHAEQKPKAARALVLLEELISIIDSVDFVHSVFGGDNPDIKYMFTDLWEAANLPALDESLVSHGLDQDTANALVGVGSHMSGDGGDPVAFYAICSAFVAETIGELAEPHKSNLVAWARDKGFLNPYITELRNALAEIEEDNA